MDEMKITNIDEYLKKFPLDPDEPAKALELVRNPQKLIDELTVDPYEAYRHLAGEAEARAVQQRMNLTPMQRQARPFWQDLDVPEGQQIVRTK